MSIQSDIRTSQNDLRTISTLLGDALSQFAKLFQNEVDLAKAEFGEKVQKMAGALAFLAASSWLSPRSSWRCLRCRQRSSPQAGPSQSLI
jgi:Putative Actinobacterial Holin-X, holin superfamily III